MDATSWTSFTALHLPSVWKWEKGSVDRRVERSKLGTLKCSCCSAVHPLVPSWQFLIFTEMNLCHANCLHLKGRTSDRFAVLDLFEMWVLSTKVKSGGVTIPRLPIFHIASGYVYFFLDMADGEILKVQRITQYYSIAELFVYYCYFRAGSALWHPHYVFHFKLPSDMWFWRLSGKKMLFALLQNPTKYSPNAFSPNLNINKIYDCLPRRIYCCWL